MMLDSRLWPFQAFVTDPPPDPDDETCPGNGFLFAKANKTDAIVACVNYVSSHRDQEVTLYDFSAEPPDDVVQVWEKAS